MAKLIETLSVQRTEILQALGQHLAISLISLVIAILIAVPLAISLRDRPFLGEAGLQVAGIIQTIPSLALSLIHI